MYQRKVSHREITYPSQSYHLNGMRRATRPPDKAKLRKKFSKHVCYRAEELPKKVNLRSEMTQVEDQSELSSCVANSFAGAYEYLLRKETGNDIDVSRLFIYYNARIRDGMSDEDLTDNGCTVTSALEALEEYGTCLESIWPYHLRKVNVRPSDDAFEAAINNKIIDALELSVDLYEMKSCLAQGYPFVFGLDLFKSFDKATYKGTVPLPNASEKRRNQDGCHAMLAVGYSDRWQAFIVRNSWGEEWGDRGYCYIPYKYMANNEYCDEVWAVRAVETDEIGQDHWEDDDDEEREDDEEYSDDEEEDEEQEDTDDEDEEEEYEDDEE